MIPAGFLNSFEAKLIARDWKLLLQSAEACTVEIKQYTKVGSTVDPVFNVPIGGTHSITTLTGQKAIQKIVTPFERDLLAWSEIKAGTSIFYFATENSAIPGTDKLEFRIITPNGSTWVSVPNPTRGLEDFLRLRLGPVSTHIGKIVVAAPEILA